MVAGVPVGRTQRPVPGVALSWLYQEGATEVGGVRKLNAISERNGVSFVK